MKYKSLLVLVLFFSFSILFSVNLVMAGPAPVCDPQCAITSCTDTGSSQGYEASTSCFQGEVKCEEKRSCDGNNVVNYVTGTEPIKDVGWVLRGMKGAGNKRNNLDCEYVLETCSSGKVCESGKCVVPKPVYECSDGKDNDGDGKKDKDDPDCYGNPDDKDTYDEKDNIESNKPQCADDNDNDGDGKKDKDDPDCRSDPDDEDTYDKNDDIEEEKPECSDGTDNDGDGKKDKDDKSCWTDLNDPDSYDPKQDSEKSAVACSKGCDVYWANNIGEKIEKTNINSLVRLVVSGNRIEEKKIEYKIFKKCEGLECILSIFGEEDEVAVSDSLGFLKWRAGKNKADKFEDGRYYFTAKVEGADLVSSEKDSVLKVDKPEKNIPPVALIIRPKDRGIYFINEVIKFKQGSYDVDDDLEYVWKFEGEEKKGDSIKLENSEFDYKYTKAGQKDVLLTVTDDREAVSRYNSAILVVDDKSQMLAYIDEPEFGEIYGKSVKLNAESTYAIEVTKSGSTISLNCLGGFCPKESAGCPVGVAESSCPIKVSGAPSSLKGANHDKIDFRWIFDGDSKNIFGGLGKKGVKGTKVFDKIGKHKAFLTASINPVSSISIFFDVSDGSDEGETEGKNKLLVFIKKLLKLIKNK